MININTLQYSVVNNNIELHATTDSGMTFTKLEYKKYDSFGIVEIVDLSSNLVGAGNVENITLDLEDLSLEEFKGLFFLVLTTSASETKEAVVGNFSSYENCLFNKLVNNEKTDCTTFLDACDNDILYFNALLTNIYRALKYEKYAIAAKLFEILKQQIDDCCTNCEQDYSEGCIYIEENELKLCSPITLI